MPPPGPSPALFFDTVNAYQRTEALRAAVELDLFTHIAAGRRTPPRSLTPLERTRGASASSPTTSRSSASSTRTATGTISPRTRPRS